jgi:hypothetical protein
MFKQKLDFDVGDEMWFELWERKEKENTNRREFSSNKLCSFVLFGVTGGCQQS